MNQLKENNVFTTIQKPKDETIVGSSWVYSRKSNLNENVVAKGYSQIEGFDYTDTFAPTVTIIRIDRRTIRMLIQIATQDQMKIHQLDVKTAYLNAPFDCTVYLQRPGGFKIKDDEGNTLIWNLNKSLYTQQERTGIQC